VRAKNEYKIYVELKLNANWLILRIEFQWVKRVMDNALYFVAFELSPEMNLFILTPKFVYNIYVAPKK